MLRHMFWIIGLMLALQFQVSLLAARAQDTADPLARALQADNVYVGKTLRARVSVDALHALTNAEPADRPLKIAVVNALPASGKQFGTRDTYTRELHDYLRLGRGTLIIVTRHGASAATSALPGNQITHILQRYGPQLQSDPIQGLKATVAVLDSAVGGQGVRPAAPARQASAGPMMPNAGAAPLPTPQMNLSPLLLLILPVILIGALLLWFGSQIAQLARKRRAMQEARLPVERLRGEVVAGISYADNYLDLLPDSPETVAARAARQQASDLYEQAGRMSRQARFPEDYGRAQALLESAREATALCRQKIDVATGGTGFAVAVDGTDYRATPATAGGTLASLPAPVATDLWAEDIPPQERGACFFCSRPARITDLTPITIALNGQRRKVLACAEDVRIVQQGATPQVRTVTMNGRPVPWYSARNYDPYRDYGTTSVSYMPGYAGYYSDNGGFTDGLLLGALLSEPTPMPYPVFVMPDGQVTDNWQAPELQSDSGAATGVGGVDFFGDSGATNANGGSDFPFNNSGDTNVGGVDFNNSAPDFSSSSVDTGSSGFDTGSSSFDTGSSSTGMDSGGGSDSSSGSGDY